MHGPVEPDAAVVARQMREDWNRRASEDAHYYVAFGRRGQSDQEFFDTGLDQVRIFLREMKRLPPGSPRARRALEIGCGPGRLLKPMSAYFGEIHGVDVSDEMIRRAAANLASIPHAHVRHAPDSTLAAYADDSFDFIYSYAVFQHIPSREVVFGYLDEANRVLKPGGILRCQINGLPPTAKSYDTWAGVRVSTGELREFAASRGLALLALEGADTQYMWTTMRKPASPPEGEDPWPVTIRRVTNASTSEPVAPVGGRFAALSLWVEGLPARADLLSLEARVDGLPAVLTHLGHPEVDGLCQLSLCLPGGVRTGFKPVVLMMEGVPLAEAWVRLIPPGPPVPRVVALMDGIDLLSGSNIVTGSVKAVLEEVQRPEELAAYVGWEGGMAPALELESFCTDPRVPIHELNFRLPPEAPRGPAAVTIAMGRRVLASTAITIAG